MRNRGDQSVAQTVLVSAVQPLFLLGVHFRNHPPDFRLNVQSVQDLFQMFADHSGSYTLFLLSHPHSLRYTISDIMSASFSVHLDYILPLYKGLLVSKLSYPCSPTIRREIA